MMTTRTRIQSFDHGTQLSAESVEPDAQRQQVLAMARQLERQGRQTERFLSMQLQQLEIAVRDFHREREAWEQQKEQELRQLQTQRANLEAARAGSARGERAPRSTDHQTDEASRLDSRRPLLAEGSGSDPLRVLLQPGSATAMQMGLLMFEFSKLNREFGGKGVRFEIHDCREPKRGFFAGSNKGDQARSIVELQAFSCQPLHSSNRGNSEPGVDLQIWEAFKSCILLSSLANSDLEKKYRGTKASAEKDISRSLVSDAARRADHANSNCYDSSRRYGPVFTATGNSNAAREQLARLERVVECLGDECGLRIHTSLI